LQFSVVVFHQLGKLFTRCGLPDGVFNVVPGMANVGRALCKHPHVRKVDLTGGTNTGRAVGAAAGENLAGVLSELGGKAPMIVFEDADIKQVSFSAMTDATM
jgi:acyl-CoA reductase-like NAD-dependent aldehyde dehydrogenase